MNPEEAINVGLVEQLGYREDVFKELEERYQVVDWKDYASTVSKGSSRDRIAIIYANGIIETVLAERIALGLEILSKHWKKHQIMKG